jgi:hypothetical protein
MLFEGGLGFNFACVIVESKCKEGFMVLAKEILVNLFMRPQSSSRVRLLLKYYWGEHLVGASS